MLPTACLCTLQQKKPSGVRVARVPATRTIRLPTPPLPPIFETCWAWRACHQPGSDQPEAHPFLIMRRMLPRPAQPLPLRISSGLRNCRRTTIFICMCTYTSWFPRVAIHPSIHVAVIPTVPPALATTVLRFVLRHQSYSRNVFVMTWVRMD
ncbi:hypothetical protein ACJQWK_10931 [Exserohilum turcicum]